MLVLDRDHLVWFGQLTFPHVCVCVCVCVCGLSVIWHCKGIL